jgi:leader peptidase (prepilin peptidase) / N-methyltransferase
MNISTWLTAIGAALAGLVVGSWVTVMIAWLPRTEPGLRLPPGHCPRCGIGLRPADLFPVSGWRRLRDRCCPAETGSGEWSASAGLVTAAVFVIMAVCFGPSPVLPAFCVLAAVGVPLAYIDAAHKRLPDPLTLPSYPVAVVLLGIAALATPDGGRHFLTGLAGLAAAWLLFVMQALIYPAGIGRGDVKLSGLLGLYLGWLGISTLIEGLVLGYLLAAVAGLALLAARRATRKSQVPFGPFLLAGALAAILLSGVGQPVLML